MSTTKKVTRLLRYYSTKDDALLSVIDVLLSQPCLNEYDRQRRYDQIIVLDAARRALRRERKP